MTARTLRIATLVAGLALVAWAAAAMPATTSGADTGCALAGTWFDSTEEVGSTQWRIDADGFARQFGLGNATGRATLSNDTLKIVWTTGEEEEDQPHGPDDDYAGVLEWKLTADCTGVGTLTFTAVAEGDPRNGNVYRSTVTGPPPVVCRRAAASDPVTRVGQCALDERAVFGFEARRLPDPEKSEGDGDIVQIEAQAAGRFVRPGNPSLAERWKATVAIQVETARGGDLTVLKYAQFGRYEDEVRDEPGTRRVAAGMKVKSSTLKGCETGEKGRLTIVDGLKRHGTSLDGAMVKYCGRALFWLDQPGAQFLATVGKLKPIPGPT